MYAVSSCDLVYDYLNAKCGNHINSILNYSLPAHSMRIKANDAFLRMPLVLAEPAFLYDLRQGVAIRSLHRISFLSRVNSIVEEALDRIINGMLLCTSVYQSLFGAFLT